MLDVVGNVWVRNVGRILRLRAWRRHVGLLIKVIGVRMAGGGRMLVRMAASIETHLVVRVHGERVEAESGKTVFS